MSRREKSSRHAPNRDHCHADYKCAKLNDCGDLKCSGSTAANTHTHIFTRANHLSQLIQIETSESQYQFGFEWIFKFNNEKKKRNKNERKAKNDSLVYVVFSPHFNFIINSLSLSALSLRHRVVLKWPTHILFRRFFFFFWWNSE